jgi:hypothetical protein
MSASTLYAVANDPNEEPMGSGAITTDDILDLYNEMRNLHPEWFVEGQGWGAQDSEEGNNAINSNH